MTTTRATTVSASLEIVADSDLSDARRAAVLWCQRRQRGAQSSEPAFERRHADLPGDCGAAIAARNIEFEVHDREWIQNKGGGAFAAVAKGTPEEPRLIVMRYNGAPDSDAPTLGFVGKAVTFSTGRISLKPSEDGGDEVRHARRRARGHRRDRQVAAGQPDQHRALDRDMPGGRATKPGDIVTALNGKTIEIDNTDAEGRLILADALTYANELRADRLVNLATLTGAIIVALGSTYAGLFSNDDDWAAKCRPPPTGELGHRLPLHPEFAESHQGTPTSRTRLPRARGRRSRLRSS